MIDHKNVRRKTFSRKVIAKKIILSILRARRFDLLDADWTWTWDSEPYLASASTEQCVFSHVFLLASEDSPEDGQERQINSFRGWVKSYRKQQTQPRSTRATAR